MQVILGIDIGTSTTKTAVLGEDKTVLALDRKASGDPKAVCETVFREMKMQGRFNLTDVSRIMLTGVGASFIEEDIQGIQTSHVTEFESQGRGGLFLGGLERAVVLSMGTGTTLVSASPEGFAHLGGSAVGGGTLTGLGSRLFGISDAGTIDELAAGGDLHRVDWHMGEINREAITTLPDFATASNLGKMERYATDADVALGLFNMIYQTAGIMAALVCQPTGVRDIIVIGSLAQSRHAGELLGRVGMLYDKNFIIPEMPVFATAIGAALAGFENETADGSDKR